jgi:ribosome biogenesis GTPase A
VNVFAEKKSFTIEVELNGTKHQRDLIEFIQENKIQQNLNIKEQSIMVLGLTGTGKSTLINYLNNIPLVCVKENKKWIRVTYWIV